MDLHFPLDPIQLARIALLESALMSQSNWPHAARSTAYRLASAVDAAVFSALPALTSFCCHHIRDIACRAPEGPPKLVAYAKQTTPRDAKAHCIQRDPAIQRPMPRRLNLEMQRIPKGTKNSFMVPCFSVLNLPGDRICQAKIPADCIQGTACRHHSLS